MNTCNSYVMINPFLLVPALRNNLKIKMLANNATACVRGGQHADEGCMAAVQVRCPGFPKSQPEQCTGFAYPIPGTWPEEGTQDSY